MFKFVNKRLRNRKGFTLIELIVVIAILGILAAIAVPRLGGFTDNAAKRADETTADLIEKAMSMYVASYDGVVPGTTTLTLSDLYAANLLETVKAPQTDSTKNWTLDWDTDNNPYVTIQ